MKSINNFFESEIIFKSILKEAKESLPTVDVSFEEWLKELPKDKDGAEVVSISGLPTEDKHNNKVIALASTSFISAYKEFKKQAGDNVKHTRGLLVIPFENFYIVMECKYTTYKTNELTDIGIFAIQPKTSSIKSIINISRSAYKVNCNVYMNGIEEEKDNIINQILKYVNKESFAEKVNKEFDVEAQEANDKAKEVTPDKCPFTLRKKKQFPDYIKHCLLKSKDNAIVKKYSYWDEAEIFVETVKKDGKNYYKVYMGDVRATFDGGKDMLYTFYLKTLGSLDKFLEYVFKPNRQKMHSELGDDGEIHIWHQTMQKHLPANLKKDCIKDENLIKDLKFHNFDIYELYKK